MALTGLAKLLKFGGPAAAVAGAAPVGQEIVDKSLPTSSENAQMAEGLKKFLGIEGLFTPENIARRDAAVNSAPDSMFAAYGVGAPAVQSDLVGDEARIANLNRRLASDIAPDQAENARRTLNRAGSGARKLGKPKTEPMPTFTEGLDPDTLRVLSEAGNININTPDIPQGPSEEDMLLQSIANQPGPEASKRPGLGSRILESISNFGNRLEGRPTREQERQQAALQQEALRIAQGTPDPVKQALLEYALGSKSTEQQSRLGSNASQQAQLLDFILKQQATGPQSSQEFEASQADLDRQNRLEIARAAGIPPELIQQILNQRQGGAQPTPKVNPIR